MKIHFNHIRVLGSELAEIEIEETSNTCIELRGAVLVFGFFQEFDNECGDRIKFVSGVIL